MSENTIDTDPGLQIETSHSIELETCAKAYHSLSENSFSPTSDCVTSHDIRFSEKSNRIDMEATVAQDIEELQTRDGKLAFLDWASNITHSGFFPQAAMDVWQCEICGSKPGWRFETTVEVLPSSCKIKFDRCKRQFRISYCRVSIWIPRPLHV